MLIGINNTSWLIFVIITFIILSYVVVGNILGLTTLENIVKRLYGATQN